jgi:hypothetical protein
MSVRMRRDGSGSRVRPWLLAITAVYGLTIAAWAAAIDWSDTDTMSRPTVVSAIGPR